MLIGAIGCNIAWGLIDAIIFLLTSLTARARGIATLQALRQATDPAAAQAILTERLPPMVADTLSAEDLDRIRYKLGRLAEPPARPGLRRNDFLAAAGIFLLVFLSTFPVLVPFIFMNDAVTALRVSNAIALGMLFLAGYSFGRYARCRPLAMGLTMMLIGSLLVMITIVLGG